MTRAAQILIGVALFVATCFLLTQIAAQPPLELSPGEWMGTLLAH